MSVSLKKQITQFALNTLGFDDCRFTSPFLSHELNDYRQMIAEKTLGDMGYLERHLPFKENPNLVLDQVKSAIVLIKSYKNTVQKHLEGSAKIARYAVGTDYHIVIDDKLKQLEAFLKEKSPNSTFYRGVDSRPIAERSLALKAGIGFKGKNSMVIKPKLGSYFFIGILFTTEVFETDPPFIGTCGSCTRCIEACPTGAILSTGGFVQNKCISYTTIEQKLALTPQQKASSEGWLFGCDICQEVCPFNHANIPLTDWEAFKPQNGVGFSFFKNHPTLEEKDIPKNTALYRSRHRIIQNHGTVTL